MTKDLIEVPDFNPNSVFYLMEVIEYVYNLEVIEYIENKYWNSKSNRKPRYKPIRSGYAPRKLRSSSQPIMSRYAYASPKEQYSYWAKFIFKSYAREYSEHVKKSRRLVRDDPLEPLWKIQKKYPKLLYKKFIFERQEQFPPLEIKPAIKGEKPKPNRNYGEVYYEVKYLEINESLITYLRNKVIKEDIELVNELQELFISSSTPLSWDEFIKSKAKFLSELDLSNYVDELNKQTNKKIKIR